MFTGDNTPTLLQRSPLEMWSSQPKATRWVWSVSSPIITPYPDGYVSHLPPNSGLHDSAAAPSAR